MESVEILKVAAFEGDDTQNQLTDWDYNLPFYRGRRITIIDKITEKSVLEL